VREPSWEQERPVSAPAVRSLGCHLRDGLGATNPNRIPVKWVRAERESEWPILPRKRGNACRGKGPHLVCGFAGGKRW
jgi:hypothetical protein